MNEIQQPVCRVFELMNRSPVNEPLSFVISPVLPINRYLMTLSNHHLLSLAYWAGISLTV
jgi:hypothetical protein